MSIEGFPESNPDSLALGQKIRKAYALTHASTHDPKTKVDELFKKKILEQGEIFFKDPKEAKLVKEEIIKIKKLKLSSQEEDFFLDIWEKKTFKETAFYKHLQETLKWSDERIGKAIKAYEQKGKPWQMAASSLMKDQSVTHPELDNGKLDKIRQTFPYLSEEFKRRYKEKFNGRDDYIEKIREDLLLQAAPADRPSLKFFLNPKKDQSWNDLTEEDKEFFAKTTIPNALPSWCLEACAYWFAMTMTQVESEIINFVEKTIEDGEDKDRGKEPDSILRVYGIDVERGYAVDIPDISENKKNEFPQQYNKTTVSETEKLLTFLETTLKIDVRNNKKLLSLIVTILSQRMVSNIGQQLAEKLLLDNEKTGLGLMAIILRTPGSDSTWAMSSMPNFKPLKQEIKSRGQEIEIEQVIQTTLNHRESEKTTVVHLNKCIKITYTISEKGLTNTKVEFFQPK